MRVGCIGLFGGDAALPRRGAPHTRYARLTPPGAEPNHAALARRNRPPLDSARKSFTFEFHYQPPNAAGNAPPRASIMRGYVWAVAFSRLLDRPLMSPLNPRDLNTATRTSGLSLFLSEAVLTPGITRPPARFIYMRAVVSRVGCMPLLGFGLLKYQFIHLISHP
jgi:hypothetical protein